jgi:hypothetical protein
MGVALQNGEACTSHWAVRRRSTKAPSGAWGLPYYPDSRMSADCLPDSESVRGPEGCTQLCASGWFSRKTSKNLYPTQHPHQHPPPPLEFCSMFWSFGLSGPVLGLLPPRPRVPCPSLRLAGALGAKRNPQPLVLHEPSGWLPVRSTSPPHRGSQAGPGTRTSLESLQPLPRCLL